MINADFKIYYDKNQRRNIWLLGYFGGGSINLLNANIIAKEYCKRNMVSFETVQIDEILGSRRFKGFKFIFSTVPQEPDNRAEVMDNVYAWLRD